MSDHFDHRDFADEETSYTAMVGNVLQQTYCPLSCRICSCRNHLAAQIHNSSVSVLLSQGWIIRSCPSICNLASMRMRQVERTDGHDDLAVTTISLVDSCDMIISLMHNKYPRKIDDGHGEEASRDDGRHCCGTIKLYRLKSARTKSSFFYIHLKGRCSFFDTRSE